MGQKPPETETDYLSDMLIGESDRACALIGGQLVDNALEDLLLACMGDASAAKTGLLDGMAPLKTFSARQKVARHFSLITQDEHADINDIREIRNDAAHKLGTHLDPRDKLFAHPAVLMRCNRLRCYVPEPGETIRWRFVMTVATLATRFNEQAARLRTLAAPAARVIAAVQGARDRENPPTHEEPPSSWDPSDEDD